MCGIFGIINASTIASGSLVRSIAYLSKGDDLLRDGMVACSLRGMDSSGVLQIDGKGQPYMHKLPLNASMFVQDKMTKSFLADAPKSSLTVAHLRAATEGKVSLNNAHPFSLARSGTNELVIGVHNGTLTSWRSGKNAKDFDVDSEWALSRITDEGVDAFEEFDGSFSFVWWDEAKPGLVNFARNEQRPMFLVRSLDKKHIVFGSEAGMLTWLAERNNLSLESSIYDLTPGKLFSVDFNKDILDVSEGVVLPKKKPAASASYTRSAASGYSYSYSKDARNRVAADVLLLHAKWAGDKVAAQGKSDESASVSAKPSESDSGKSAARQAVLALEGDYPADLGSFDVRKESEYFPMVAEGWEHGTAETEGLIGTLVRFFPLSIEGTVATGEIEVIVFEKNESKELKRGAEMRFPFEAMPPHVDEFLDYGVIVGLDYDEGGNFHYILSPLTDEGLKTLTLDLSRSTDSSRAANH